MVDNFLLITQGRNLFGQHVSFMDLFARWYPIYGQLPYKGATLWGIFANQNVLANWQPLSRERSWYNEATKNHPDDSEAQETKSGLSLIFTNPSFSLVLATLSFQRDQKIYGSGSSSCPWKLGLGQSHDPGRCQKVQKNDRRRVPPHSTNPSKTRFITRSLE
jgi:hypothetical protein